MWISMYLTGESGRDMIDLIVEKGGKFEVFGRSFMMVLARERDELNKKAATPQREDSSLL
jgi:hypothetical protein